MKPGDVLLLAMEDFGSTKFKTTMSPLGIIIGVIAIVVMLSVGEGLYQGASTSFGDLQLNTLIVLPGTLYFTADFRQTSQAERPPAQPGETF